MHAKYHHPHSRYGNGPLCAAASAHQTATFISSEHNAPDVIQHKDFLEFISLKLNSELFEMFKEDLRCTLTASPV